MESISFENGDIQERKQRAKQYLISKRKEVLAYFFGCLAVGIFFLWLYIKAEKVIPLIVSIISFLWVIAFLCSDIPKLCKQFKKLNNNFEELEGEIEHEKVKAKQLKEDSERRQAETEAMIEERKRKQHEYDHPECPMCKSHNTRRISTANRAVSVATVGLASSKIGKQYECFNCKHKW